MGKVTIYHNARCGKSREALRLIEAAGHEVEVVAYLQEPPSADRLDALCAAMGIEPKALIRSKEPRFTELGLSLSDRRPRSEWLRILCENPILIERPIVVCEGRVVLARPPEVVLEIL